MNQDIVLQVAREQANDWNLLVAEKIVKFRIYRHAVSNTAIAVEFFTSMGSLRHTCPPYTPVIIEEVSL